MLEEHEEHKQEEINQAIAYMESQYAKELEEFKHKELRTVLSEAREQWEKEQESEFEDIVKVCSHSLTEIEVLTLNKPILFKE